MSHTQCCSLLRPFLPAPQPISRLPPRQPCLPTTTPPHHIQSLYLARSTPTLQAWIRVYILHISLSPCVHPTLFHLKPFHTLGLSFSIFFLLPQPALFITDREWTKKCTHVQLFSQKYKPYEMSSISPPKPISHTEINVSQEKLLRWVQGHII